MICRMRRLLWKLRIIRGMPASLNRRAEVEQVLFDVARGKRPMLSKQECWDLAMKLGGA